MPHPLSAQDVINDELPIEEIGFNSITELLQRVPGIDVSKPPDSAKLMVFCTTPISDSETESSDSGDRMSAKEKDAMVRRERGGGGGGRERERERENLTGYDDIQYLGDLRASLLIETQNVSALSEPVVLQSI